MGDYSRKAINRGTASIRGNTVTYLSLGFADFRDQLYALANEKTGNEYNV